MLVGRGQVSKVDPGTTGELSLYAPAICTAVNDDRVQIDDMTPNAAVNMGWEGTMHGLVIADIV